MRAARRAARCQLGDAAGARVSATRSNAATERAIRYARLKRSGSIGTDREVSGPEARAVSRNALDPSPEAPAELTPLPLPFPRGASPRARRHRVMHAQTRAHRRDLGRALLARRARRAGLVAAPRRGSFFPVGARDEPVTAGAAAREPEAVGRRRGGCGVPRARIRDGGGARGAEARLECLLVPAFNEVWAEAARFAKVSARPRGVAAWRALPRLPRLAHPLSCSCWRTARVSSPRSPRGSPTSRARSCSFWWAAQTSRRRRRGAWSVAAAGARLARRRRRRRRSLARCSSPSTPRS